MINEGERVEMSIDFGGAQRSIYFETQGAILQLCEESIIAATLLPAMKFDEPLVIPEEADAQFLNSLDQIQDVFTTWDKSFSKVLIDAKPTEAKYNASRGVGTFFTGGVDSFYTFLKHKDEIRYLVYVHGYENHKISTEILKIAEHFDKEVLEVRTNLRDFSDPIVDWTYYIGPALATVAHLLKSQINKIYIPSTFTYSVLIPSGTHPLVDPLWSSSDLQIIHDGCEATRIDKVALIAQYKKALNAIRVCWKDTGKFPNCGKCEKCIRTMLNLQAIGALGKCKNLPNKILLRKVAGIMADTEGKRAWILENLDRLKAEDQNKQLVRALQWVLIKPFFLMEFRRKLVRIRSRLRNMLKTVYLSSIYHQFIFTANEIWMPT